MMKKAIFIFVIIFAVFFIIGYTIENNKKQNTNTESNINDGKVINIIDDTDATIEVNSNDEKATPNTTLVLKKRYKKCGHEISSKTSLPEEMVNLTKDEIEEKYSNWELEEFGTKRIILSKKVDTFCGEHYLLTEENGKIKIYTVDEEGNRGFKKVTDIEIEYLPETDRITLKNGIMVYGRENLNKILEDYET